LKRFSFDQRAAEIYAPMVGRVRRAGTPIAMADGQNAAIAAAHCFAAATRDVTPFLAGGVPVINPWMPGAALP
jgi:predicted nucleic acid-binding protein